MPAGTVIDQLIVKLGLDPREFTKGQKQAAAAVATTEKEVKRSSEGMGSSLMGVSRKLLGLASAAVVLKKSISYVSDLSTSVRQLGIDSRSFGIAANELRNFQNVAEMEGGKAEDATKTIGNLSRAIYDMAYNGQVSDSLLMLGRLGVRFQDTSGKARNFTEVILDTQAKIQGAMQSGQLSRENAGFALQQAGFDTGLSQAILNGTVSSQLAQQNARRSVTQSDINAATTWERSAANRDQSIAAATLRALPGAATAGTAANNAIAAGADLASGAGAQSASQELGASMHAAADNIKAGADSLVNSFEELGAKMWRGMFPKGRDSYEKDIQGAARKYGISPDLLAGVLSTESNFDPAAVSGAGAVGIAQLMPKYFPNAGRNPHEDIDTAAAYLKSLRESFMKDGNDGAAADYLALQSYNAGQSRVRKAMNGGPALTKETQDYPGKVLDYARRSAVPTPNAQNSSDTGVGTSNSTETNIGTVTIQTQATDADGIARDFVGAARRKFNAAQAETGVN